MKQLLNHVGDGCGGTKHGLESIKKELKDTKGTDRIYKLTFIKQRQYRNPHCEISGNKALISDNQVFGPSGGLRTFGLPDLRTIGPSD